MVCLGLGIVLTLVFRLYLTWVNRTRDRTAAVETNVVVDSAGNMVNLMDKTDKEIEQFRYVY